MCATIDNVVTIARRADRLVQSVSLALQVAHDPDFEAGMRSWIHSAVRVHSDFAPSADALARQLTACLDGHDRQTWSEHLRTLSAPDVWLCAALTQGEDKVVRIFERRLGPEIHRALGRFSLSEDQRAELAQRVRVRLLVSTDEGPPRIGLYRGWGSLEGWVRTVTARLALNELRDHKGAQPLERAPELIGASPEFAALRTSRRELFMQALRQAFQSLGHRERALLRLRYLEGVHANALAESYDVHESTMSRWLSNARTELQRRFDSAARTLVADDAAVADLLGAMQSRFGQSLQQLFVSEVTDATQP
ncbi:MAG: sigma-70 family RNA polymerase sigma factor [Nannocystaceae bacterium]|nr:sigma-70 family RNA polymerase sigma factor [Nannocystaceae bacterium]